MTVGMYAGSFDPIHLGHLHIIESAARWCTRLYVVAAGNPSKSSGLFTIEERRALIEASTTHLPNVTARSHNGLVSDLARQLGADALVRGVGKDRGPEFEMAVTNRVLCGILTVFQLPDRATEHISSSDVRRRIATDGHESIVELVPAALADRERRATKA